MEVAKFNWATSGRIAMDATHCNGDGIQKKTTTSNPNHKSYLKSKTSSNQYNLFHAIPAHPQQRNHVSNSLQLRPIKSQRLKCSSTKPSLSTASHNTSENLIPILQLLDTILEELSLALGRQGLRSNGFHFRIQHSIYDDRWEDLLEPAHDMSLDNLSCDICDECPLWNLGGSQWEMAKT